MSRRIKLKTPKGITKDVAVIVEEPPRHCELCGAFAECRPYGPRGEQVCYPCAMKDLECTERQMKRVLFGEDVQ